MTLTYLLPLRRDRVALEAGGELVRYLTTIAGYVNVLIVDGSSPPLFARHSELFAGVAEHIALDPSDRCANGKAWAVLTGLRRAHHDGVVIADDDVRWDAMTLARAQTLLEGGDLVVPANYFAPMTWHAAWDTGRILLNRALAHDWPGTLVVRRSALAATPRYDGDVLFENCELVRTVAASGGRVRVAPDLLVARRPPTVRHFLGQRPRQAYDDLAQPARMLAMLAIVPAAVLGGRRAVAAGALFSLAVAEAGRRAGGGRRVFPWYTSLGAPAWLGERAVLSWWVLCLRLSDRGVRYGDHRLLRAATPLAELRARHGGGRV
ncbi:MAG: glycosyltransferase family 2 protein [Candidatus Dormibacteraeota bacterium]|nr:glycosyltransferase family 2 protein [Candidatus Dormibacteraeota bacterium]